MKYLNPIFLVTLVSVITITCLASCSPKTAKSTNVDNITITMDGEYKLQSIIEIVDRGPEHQAIDGFGRYRAYAIVNADNNSNWVVALEVDILDYLNVDTINLIDSGYADKWDDALQAWVVVPKYEVEI